MGIYACVSEKKLPKQSSTQKIKKEKYKIIYFYIYLKGVFSSTTATSTRLEELRLRVFYPRKFCVYKKFYTTIFLVTRFLIVICIYHLFLRVFYDQEGSFVASASTVLIVG